ncbi:MAG: hypothetical protein AAF602_02605 [Myxococcota bacterium]
MNVEIEPGTRDLMRVIELLHAFIRDDVVPELIPVDVADYRHLADQPRVLLVGHRGLVSVIRKGDAFVVGYRHRRDPLSDEAATALLSTVVKRLEVGLA